MEKKDALSMERFQAMVEKVYLDSFGRTPLRQRIEDIFGEAIELHRYTDMKNLREEAGDLLSSLIQLINECEWNAADLLEENLKKIKKRKDQYRGMGRKTKVALLGGAFNPVTKGHIQVAQFVLDSSKTFDEVWLLPCFKHRYNKKMESPSDRLKMCALAAEGDGRIKTFHFEISNKLAGETYHLVKRLLDEDYAKNQYDFSLIIGMDNANSFDKWVNYEDLERMIRFIIVPRTGEEVAKDVDWYLKQPHILLKPDPPLMDISSTFLRNIFIESRESNFPDSALERIEGKIDPKVLKYIQEKKLYAWRDDD